MALAKRGKGIGCTVAEMCGELSVSTSGYHSYAARKARGFPKGSRLIALMMPRLLGAAMNRKKISRLMRRSGLFRRANPLRRIARAIQTGSVFSNKLNRQFAVSRPGRRGRQSVSHQAASDNGLGIAA